MSAGICSEGLRSRLCSGFYLRMVVEPSALVEEEVRACGPFSRLASLSRIKMRQVRIESGINLSSAFRDHTHCV